MSKVKKDKVKKIKKPKFNLKKKSTAGNVKQNNNTYNPKKADLVCTVVILAVCLLIIVSNILGVPFAEAMSASIPIFIAMGVVVVLFFIRIPSKIKAIIFSLVILLGSIMALVSNPSDQTNQYTIMASIVILGLYFSSKLIFIYMGIVNVTFIAIYIIDDVILFGVHRPLNFLISTLFMVNGIFIVLYFINKWGNGMITQAKDKEKALKLTLDEIDKSSALLDNNVIELNSNMDSIVASSSNTSKSMNEIAIGTSQQAQEINSINSNVTGAFDEVTNTQLLSEKISQNSTQISTNISKGAENIGMMAEQMETINNAVSTALTTVNALKSNINDINKYLKGITDIARETKLLSINASIEAAKAGQQGKGFSVVADQVGNLALQSDKIVKSIGIIMEDIYKNSVTAVEKVSQGEEAVTAGNTMIETLGSSFSEMETSMNETFELLNEENKMVNNVLQQFTYIKSNVESISCISQQHAAANEEILAAIQNENKDILAIKSSIEDIQELSDELSSLSGNNADETEVKIEVNNAEMAKDYAVIK